MDGLAKWGLLLFACNIRVCIFCIMLVSIEGGEVAFVETPFQVRSYLC